MITQGAFNKLFSPELRKSFDEEIKVLNELDYKYPIVASEYIPKGMLVAIDPSYRSGFNIGNIGVDWGNGIAASAANLSDLQNQAFQNAIFGHQSQPALGGSLQQQPLNQGNVQALFDQALIKRSPKWYDKYKDVADYDYNTDSITIRATGERVSSTAIQDGYKPYLSNTEWLDAKISQVRNYAYAGTITRDLRQYRVLDYEKI